MSLHAAMQNDLRRSGGRPRRWQWRLLGVAIFFLLPASAHAQDTFKWTTNYYSVTGSTLAELRQSIRQSRTGKDGVTADGVTVSELHWRTILVPSARGCRCTSFTTQTTITTTLPVWAAPTNTPPAVKTAWGRYFVALAQHEAGHSQITLAAVAELHRRIGGLDEASDCDGLKKKIDDLAQQIVKDYHKRDKDYDERTRHGATQGVFLPAWTRPER
jgi:predicted secreted Zn-dependent protease